MWRQKAAVYHGQQSMKHFGDVNYQRDLEAEVVCVSLKRIWRKEQNQDSNPRLIFHDTRVGVGHELDGSAPWRL